jgi:hypothetical protein
MSYPLCDVVMSAHIRLWVRGGGGGEVTKGGDESDLQIFHTFPQFKHRFIWLRSPQRWFGIVLYQWMNWTMPSPPWGCTLQWNTVLKNQPIQPSKLMFPSEVTGFGSAPCKIMWSPVSQCGKPFYSQISWFRWLACRICIVWDRHLRWIRRSSLE